MRDFIVFLTALVILAIVQTLAAALTVAAGIFALICVVTYPRRTFQLIGSIGLLTLATREPAWCVAALGAVGVAFAVAGRVGRRRTPRQLPRPLLLLTDERRD